MSLEEIAKELDRVLNLNNIRKICEVKIVEGKIELYYPYTNSENKKKYLTAEEAQDMIDAMYRLFGQKRS